MKKLIAILLSLTFVLSVSVFAGTIKSDSKAVVGSYQAASDTTVYSVDISWGNMQFIYKEASNGTWNPETLQYDDPNDAGWFPVTNATESTLASNQIRITNKSNENIDCTPTFTLSTDEDVNGVKGSFLYDNGSKLVTINSLNINKATVGKATEEVILLSLEGQPYSKVLDSTTVGTVTIEINS